MKVVYLATAPLPYDTPILNELAKSVDLHVVYLRESHAMSSFVDRFGVDPEFAWSTHRSLSVRLPGSDFWSQATVGLAWKLEKLQADVVLSKSWNPFIFEPLLWKIARKRALLLWSESTRFSGLLRGRLSQRLRRLVLRSADQIVTIGTQATAYIVEDLGVPSSKVRTSCLPSGVADAAVLDGRCDRVGELRVGAPRYLFVGRLVALKQVERLLDAFRSVQHRHEEATLTIIGDGPLRAELQAAARDSGAAVSFLGWMEGPELSQAMLEHDVLVLPSEREVWGLVVNEGLAHGLFVIATDEVGSAHDLLISSALGLRVPARDTGALREAMLEVADNGYLSDEHRRARAKSMLGKDANQFAEDLAETARLALAARRR